jgi:putative oxidoreductase
LFREGAGSCPPRHPLRGTPPDGGALPEKINFINRNFRSGAPSTLSGLGQGMKNATVYCFLSANFGYTEGMNKLPLVARLLLGIIFFVFGLNGFLHFLPMPPMEGPAAVYFTGLMATGFFLPLMALTQTVCGLLLLVGRYVPLALVILAPMIIHIFLFHAFMGLSGLGLALLLVVLEAYLAFFVEPYRAKILPLFQA